MKIAACSLLTLLGLTSAAFADDAIINAEVQKALDETNRSMEQSVAQMDKQMQVIMPQIADSMSQMMINVFKTLPPLLTTMEQNKVFSKAANQMEQDLQKSTAELRQQFDTAAASAKDASQDSYVISGRQNDNGKILDFTFNENPETYTETQNLLQNVATPAAQNLTLKAPEGQILALNSFKKETINGREYLVNDNFNNGTLITGNFNDRLTLMVYTAGADATARARQFIADFKLNR